MTNHLAAELRGILDDLDSTPRELVESHVRPRLERLAEHVERVGSEPAETTQTTDELDPGVFEAEPGGCSRSPLTPDQEIRSDALGHAVELVVMSSNRLPGAVLDLAEKFADWIRDGERP